MSSPVTASDFSNYLKLRAQQVEKCFANQVPIWQIVDQKKWAWNGETLRYFLETPPGGGFGIVPASTGALNTTGTQKLLNRLDFTWTRPFATLELLGDVLDMERAGALDHLGKHAEACEQDWLRHAGALTCLDGSGILGTHATKSGVTLTGVKGFEGTTEVQPQHLWPGQQIQIGTGGTKENATISSIARQGDGTYTLTFSAITNEYSDVNIYVYGGADSPWYGLLALCDDDNTLGSGNTLNRSSAGNEWHRSYVVGKDDVRGNFSTDPIFVLKAVISTANAKGGGGGGKSSKRIDTIFMHDAVLDNIINPLRGKQQWTEDVVYGWPALRGVIPGVTIVTDDAFPFGYIVGFHKDDLDRPTLKSPTWVTGTEGPNLRIAGYDKYEAVFGGKFNLFLRNLGLSFRITGFNESAYMYTSY